MTELIISVAPNGARKTKKDHPAIPLSPQELAQEAAACVEAGAGLFHLHIRDDNDGHSLAVERYQAAIEAIRNKVGDRLIIQVTTESCGIYTPEEQIAMVKAVKPEAISVAIRELIPSPEYEAAAAAFFVWIEEQQIVPQYILYSPAEIEYFASLRNKGVIPAGPQFFLFVLGKKNAPDQHSSYAQPEDIIPFMQAKERFLNADDQWGICAFGAYENACMLEAAQRGGHVRMGFENNHMLADGTVAANNAALVSQFKQSLGDKRKVVAAELARKLIA